MTTGVCSLWGWGADLVTPTFLMRTYDLNGAKPARSPGRSTDRGNTRSLGTAWLLSRPSMVDPRRVLWVLVAGWFTTIPSFLAFWTHTLWLGKWHVLDFHSGDLILHRSLYGLLQNLAPHNIAIDVHRWSCCGKCASI